VKKKGRDGKGENGSRPLPKGGREEVIISSQK